MGAMMKRIAVVVAAVISLAGCSLAEMQALDRALEQQMYATHGSPLAWGADAALTAGQIHALRGR